MDLIKNRFLLVPFLILLLIFFADKVLLLEAVQINTMKYNKIEHHFYDSRTPLFKSFLEDAKANPNQKFGLILGTSRSSEFSTDEIAKHIPGSRTYNFSAPQAGHSYHAYWLEKILNAGIRPSFVILESDPITLGPNSERFPLMYSLDVPFVLGNLDPIADQTKPDWTGKGGFSTDELETFLLNHMFASYKFPIDLRASRSNEAEHVLPDPFLGMKFTTGLELRKTMLAGLYAANRANLGAIPNPSMLELPEALMAADAKSMYGLHVPKPYVFSRSQVYFFRRAIKRLADARIPVVIYWPPTAKQFREYLINNGSYAESRKGTETILSSLAKPDWHATLLDVDAQRPVKCRVFFDSIHIAGTCFPELTSVILKDLKLFVK